MAVRVGIVMDPIQDITFKKDSSLAMLLEAQNRGWELCYFEQPDLFLKEGVPYGKGAKLEVADNPNKWYSLEDKKIVPLADCDVILMRVDPPFNQAYIYTTYLLEYAERLGVMVVNKPQSLRDANEKLFSQWFPACTPTTIVTQSISDLTAFYQGNEDIVCKSLDVMGGQNVFRLRSDDVNSQAIFENLTDGGKTLVMAQTFIPEIEDGDKRILMINGEAIPHALARKPQGGDWRGNLAAGAKGFTQPLTERDQWIANQVSPVLKEKGLYFVGLDVIGDYLTEINVTSPTCIREIHADSGFNAAAALMDFIESTI